MHCNIVEMGCLVSEEFERALSRAFYGVGARNVYTLLETLDPGGFVSVVGSSGPNSRSLKRKAS